LIKRIKNKTREKFGTWSEPRTFGFHWFQFQGGKKANDRFQVQKLGNGVHRIGSR